MVAQRAADLVNGKIDAVFKINESGLAPKASLNLFASHQASGTLHEKQEEAERLGLQFHEHACLAEFPRGRVQHERAKGVARRAW